MTIPFMPKKGQPPLHLREWTTEEQELFARMVSEAEAQKRVAEASRRK